MRLLYFLPVIACSGGSTTPPPPPPTPPSTSAVVASEATQPLRLQLDSWWIEGAAPEAAIAHLTSLLAQPCHPVRASAGDTMHLELRADTEDTLSWWGHDIDDAGLERCTAFNLNRRSLQSGSRLGLQLTLVAEENLQLPSPSSPEFVVGMSTARCWRRVRPVCDANTTCPESVNEQIPCTAP